MKLGGNQPLRQLARQSTLWLKIAVLIFAAIAPALMTDQASAAQLTPRSLALGTSESGATTTYKFDFQIPTATAMQGMIFEFCEAPLGTCVKPTGMDVSGASVSAQTFNQVDDSFAVYNGVDLGDCTAHDNAGASTQVCVDRADGDPEEADDELDAKSITLSGIDNPTLSGVTYSLYIRITVYSDTGFATDVHAGTVAGAVVNQLTSVGRVAERLMFCAGAMSDSSAMPSSCDDSITTFPTETNIDMGIIDNVNVTATPVNPTIANANLSNDRYGLLMVNTNASSGVVITYFPEPVSSVVGGDTDQLRSFRVIPTDCSATVTSETDQCFESVGESGGSIAAPDEKFGLAVACIHPKSGTSTSNFKPANGGTIGAAYVGDGDFDDDNIGFEDDCENEVFTSYTWGFDDNVGNGIATLASAASVVDDEAIKIRFGAIAASTTPTGTYAVTTTYIATATF